MSQADPFVSLELCGPALYNAPAAMLLFPSRTILRNIVHHIPLVSQSVLFHHMDADGTHTSCV